VVLAALSGLAICDNASVSSSPKTRLQESVAGRKRLP
jgi:hypothetical protein